MHKSETRTIKVLGAGSPILDLLLNVEDEFISKISGGKGGMVHVNANEMNEIIKMASSKPSMVPGGSAANTIFGLAELGLPTAFLGKVGNDNEGRFYVERYAGMGGDIGHFKKTADKPTGRCLSMVTPDSERTMRTDLGAASLLSPEDIAEENFSGIGLVHIEGYLLFNRPLLQKILEIAKKHTCKISLDLASYEVVGISKDVLPDMLTKYVDIVFANEDEAAAFTGTKDMDRALDVLSEYCGTAIVKLGKKGSIIRSGGEKVTISAELVDKPVDTTGAGDLWASGFLYGFLNGKSLADSGKFASLVSAEVVKVMGAAIPSERWLQIKKIIRNAR